MYSPSGLRTFSAPDLAGLGVGGTSDLDRAPTLLKQWAVQWKRHDKININSTHAPLALPSAPPHTPHDPLPQS